MWSMKQRFVPRLWQLVLIVLFVASCGQNASPTPIATVTTTATAAASPPAEGKLQTAVIAKGLEVPWSVVFLPDGRALISERKEGKILAFDPNTNKIDEVQQIDSHDNGEGGLLGLAISPHYDTDHYLYAYYTSKEDNRIVRFHLGETPEVIFSGIPFASNHNGGRIAFGPDGLLYVGTGDASNKNNAQNRDSLGGKILRLTPDGKVPDDNPFPNNPVYSYGHRNVQGLTWNAKGELYASELGQDTYDEINKIVAGGNYGWPIVEGVGNKSEYHDPITTFSTAEASPSGATFLVNGAIPQWEGNFLMTALRGECLWRVVIDDSGKVTQKEALFKGEFGRLRLAAQAPDGTLWLLTSNRDGRGTPSNEDDRIIRVFVG